MNFSNVLRHIYEDVDEASYTSHYNMLICMITSATLFLGSIANFVVRYIYLGTDLPVVILDSAVLILLGAGFEIYMRTRLGSLRGSMHILSLMYVAAFVFIMTRMYFLAGPSIWVLGLVQVLFSMAQSSSLMLRYVLGSILLSIIYAAFLVPKPQIGLVYDIMLITFFVLSVIVAVVVYKVINRRNRKIAVQYEKIMLEREQRKKAQKENIKLSFYDAQTGLPNMTLCKEKLNQALFFAKRNAGAGCVFFINMDMFKMVNDIAGHTIGDTLLKLAGERLSSICEYSFVARAGGDEFVVIVQGASEDDKIISIAGNILQGMEQPFMISGHKLNLTCSLGVSKFPADGKDAEALVKCAELAMYKAKEEGGGRYAFYSEDLKQSIQAELDIITDMREALQNDEFTLYYQPQINSADESIIGFEALIRWNHPVRGLMMPGEFISIAEKTGLIVPIGEWAIRKACAQNKAWQDEGIVHVPVAVNISSKHIYDDSIIKCLSQVLKETGLDPGYLELEITERVLIKDAERAKEILRNIKQLGVKIAIDDFGTGYSSIYYLKQLPVNILKIPMEFIHGINKNVKDESIISVILMLADNLNMGVIAEGVETKEQLEFLKGNLCDGIQGFYFSRPMEAEKVKDYCGTVLIADKAS